MGGRFAADINAFVNMTVEAMRKTLQDSVQDVLDKAQTPQVSMARGATSVIPGQIPVDNSELRNSLVSGLNGAFGAPAPNSYELVIRDMDLGDIAQFAWTAPHAYRIEVGWSTYPGAHFVGRNAAQWPEIVEANAAKYRVP